MVRVQFGIQLSCSLGGNDGRPSKAPSASSSTSSTTTSSSSTTSVAPPPSSSGSTPAHVFHFSGDSLQCLSCSVREIASDCYQDYKGAIFSMRIILCCSRCCCGLSSQLDKFCSLLHYKNEDNTLIQIISGFSLILTGVVHLVQLLGSLSQMTYLQVII